MTEVLKRHRLLLEGMHIVALLKALGYSKEFSVGNLFISYIIPKQDLECLQQIQIIQVKNEINDPRWTKKK